MINDVYHDDHAESSNFNIQVFPQSLVMHSFPLQLQNLQSMQHATCLQRAFEVVTSWRCGPTRKRPKMLTTHAEDTKELIRLIGALVSW